MFSCIYCEDILNTENDLENHIASVHGAAGITLLPEPLDKISEDTVSLLYSNSTKLSKQLKVQKDRERNASLLKISELQFSCVLCNKKFKQVVDLKKHIQIAYGYDPCKDCVSIKTNEDFELHLKNVHKIFSCPLCKTKIFSDFELLRQHLINVHRNCVVVCHYCLKLFPDQSYLNSHYQKDHIVTSDIVKGICVSNLQTFECKLCSKTFNQVQDYELHKLVKHKNQLKLSSNANTSTKKQIGKIQTYKCEYCPKQYTKSEHLQQHENDNHRFPCNYCHNKFASDTDREKHVLEIHAIACEYCPKKFIKLQDLLKHKSENHYFPCTHCPNIFTSAEDQKHHIQTIHTITCEYCSKKFLKLEDIQQHKKAKHKNTVPHNYCENIFISDLPKQNPTVEDDKFICEYCPNTFSKLDSLLQHKFSKHMNVNCFLCEYCLKIFDTKTSRQNHIDTVHGVKCEYSAKSFNKMEHLQQHKDDNHVGIDYVSCGHCKQIFTTVASLKIHIKAFHTFPCEYCPKKYTQNEHLQQHKHGKHKNIDYFPCDYCQKEFTTVNGKDNHSQAVHTFKCDYCKKIFTTAKGKDSHTQAVHKFNCDYCEKIFTTAKGKDSHTQAVHTFKCDYCEKIFTTADGKDNHTQAVHTFKCDYCEKIFTTANGKDNHTQAVHTFECDYYSKIFAQVEHLNQHENDKHKNIDYFICEHCQKKFNSITGRNAHIQTVHLLTCEYCTKQCSKIEHLQQHKNDKHLMIDYFPCEYCLKIFTSVSSLNQHISGSHLFKCCYCEEQFSSKINLSRHKHAKHENIDYFPCNSCQKELTSDKGRETHVELVHYIFRCLFCSKKFATLELAHQHENDTHKNDESSQNVSAFNGGSKDNFTCSYCEMTFTSKLHKNVHELEAHVTAENKFTSDNKPHLAESKQTNDNETFEVTKGAELHNQLMYTTNILKNLTMNNNVK